MAGRVIALILVISLSAFLAACGGRSSSTAGVVPTTNTPTGTPAPSLEELEAKLWAELDRLGIDPERSVAAAPSGATNGVFDLEATVIDPDGAGEEPPTGVELTWTERLLADYDMNGQVNVSDLTPIGQRWDETISYDAAGLHDGIAYWPDGAPETDAGNWRLARVDGNANGLIEAADITTIGQHWMEVLTGYRVYRRAPGSDTFVRLANPESSVSMLTIPRPESIDQSGPVRYTFTDTPPGMGEYEYYVIGWSELTGHSSSEAETESNHVTARMSVSLTDTTPPTWDSTVGITAATDNTDGTVTVEWGTATDIAVYPAPATPPVTYTVYYSTETPLDFSNAAMVDGLDTTSWTSGKLVAGQEYHFAVRCRDSAADPNEDTNTNELSVTVTDPEPVEDTDPPVWTEVIPYQEPGGKPLEYTIEGIKEVRVSDRKVTIAHANAVDLLNPPVHYDLYYLSDRVDDWIVEKESGQAVINPEAQVIEDIPATYELEWDNRHGVYLYIQARDSAQPQNRTTNTRSFFTTPTKLKRIPLDMNLPGIDQIDPVKYHQSRSDSCFDRHSRTRYICYTYSMHDDVAPDGTVWVLALDMETGEWVKDFEESYLDGDPQISEFAVNQSGQPWLRLWISQGFNLGYSRYYYREGPQDWRIWDPPGIEGDWLGCFDQNDLPVFYELADSSVNPGDQFKLYYNWWNTNTESWHHEFVCDPCGYYMTASVVRPDGVTMLTTTDDLVAFADPVPLYGHLLERSVEGVWTEIMREHGRISIGTIQPYWGAQWALGGGIAIGTSPFYSDHKKLIYGTDGYTIIENEDYLLDEQGQPHSPSWPMEGGGYCSGIYWIYHNGYLLNCANSFNEQHFPSSNDPSCFSRYIPAHLYTGIEYDYTTGWYSSLSYTANLADWGQGTALHTAGSEDSFFDPEVVIWTNN